jgi:hypothetical protein
MARDLQPYQPQYPTVASVGGCPYKALKDELHYKPRFSFRKEHYEL